MDGVDPGVQEFADHVIDRLLGRGAGLFPAGKPDIELSGGEVVTAPEPTSGSALVESTGAAGSELARARSRMQRLGEESGQVVAATGETGLDGRNRAEQVREVARKQVAAIMPLTNSAAGMRLLVSTLDTHVGALQDQLDATKKVNVVAAARLRELAAGYSTVQL